jgi:hypothetical protein
MTDISVGSLSFQVERRSWLLSPHGTDPGTTLSGTLDISAFDATQHRPNGYIPSGTVLGVITATGLLAPMLAANSDGSQTAVGILLSSVKVPNLADLTKDAGCAYMVHGFVDAAKLPFTSADTAGGFITTAGRTSLKLIHFVN